MSGVRGGAGRGGAGGGLEVSLDRLKDVRSRVLILLRFRALRVDPNSAC